MSDLIKIFGNEKRWTNWRYEKVNDKLTKVPYFSKNKKAESNNENTWRTYDEVYDSANNGSNKFDGLGIFFRDDKLLLGVDIDHCLQNGVIIHDKKDIIESFIKASNTFIEISPSGNGLHCFFILDQKFDLIANKKAPFEVYNTLRYLTVTNNIFNNVEIRRVTIKEMESLLSIIGYPWGKDIKITIPSSTVENLSDDLILQKMFKSKNGSKFKKIYEGDTGDYPSASEADYAFVGALSFWSGRNANQMERIWLNSPVGQREKTKTRAKYRTDVIKSIIETTQNVYESPAMKIKKENPELDLLFKITKDGDKVFIQNTENICRVLRDHPNFKNRFRYDVFNNTLEILPTKTNKWRNIEDNDAVNIQTAISIIFPCFATVGKIMVYEAIIKIAKENTIDSASDFITSLVWDKIPRLDSWLTKTYGAPDDAVHRAIGSNWIKGLVKRIIEPGCKFDYVLVLEGQQGVKKSTSLAVLGGDWHVETTMSTDTKDFFMQFQGKAIIEFSEGETLSRTEVKRMKAIITMQRDKYRPPYERNSQDFPRRCVFAMTTNQTEYLKDETGNRRWLPVAVLLPVADIEWLKENRNQIFAEAYHRVFTLKETIYEFPDEIFKIQKERQIRDPNEDLIRNWYFGKLTKSQRQEGITVFQVYRDALHGSFPSKPMSKYDEMSIAGVLKDAMNLYKNREQVNGVRMTRWYNPEESSITIEEDVLANF